MHFPMVAGIVLVALGLKKTLAHVERSARARARLRAAGRGRRSTCSGHVAFRFRHIHTINRRRLLLALALLALLPAAVELSALATLALVAALLCALIAYETISYGEGRDRVRHQDFAPERPAA